MCCVRCAVTADASVAGGTFLLGPDIRDSKAFLDKVQASRQGVC